MTEENDTTPFACDEAMECVPCDYCGRNEPSLFFVENGYRLNRCGGCGLLYVNPRPKYAGTFEKYSHDYIGYVDAYVKQREIYEIEAERRLAEIEAMARPGQLLDVGCAAGIFLERARSRGWHVSGVEPDEQLARYATRKLGLDVKVCDFMESGYPPDAFDVVTANNIICHVRSPERFFREVYRIVKPGGWLFLNTGNNAEMTARKQGEMLGEHWGTPDHLFHFTQSHLENYMTRAGFAVEKVVRTPLIRLLFSEDNLRTFKGSHWRSRLKSLLLRCPPLRVAGEWSFTLYYEKIRRCCICKLAFVARKPGGRRE